MTKSIEKTKLAPLLGVVLAGGDSIRMGKDKSKISYRSESHEVFTAQLLEDLTDKVVISKQKKSDINAAFEIIEDLLHDRGPLGAIYSVQKAYPNYALLVLACDLPLIDKATIIKLIEARKPLKDITAVKSSDSENPEPLLAIYEPSTTIMIENYIDSGFSNPTRVLMNSNIHILELDSAMTIMNANTPEDEEMARKLLDNPNT